MSKTIDLRSRRDGRRDSGGAQIPPHNLQAEESLLGAMLLTSTAIADSSEICQPADFYKPAHRLIFEAILQLYRNNEPVDPVTVADELSRQGQIDAIGGPATLLSLQANTPATSNAPRYARIVEEHALLRRVIEKCHDIAGKASDRPEDVDDFLEIAEQAVYELRDRRLPDSLRSVDAIVGDYLAKLSEPLADDNPITGTPTGYADYDELVLGWQPGTLNTIGARPAMGKTGYLLGAAVHAATHTRRPVVFFSLEMSEKEITQRMLSMLSGVSSERLRRPSQLTDEDWRRLAQAEGQLKGLPFIVDENPEPSAMEIRAKCRRIKAQHGDLALVAVDYLQLMKSPPGAERRDLEVGENSRGLKILARELEVPVVAACQVNRGCELRVNKRPILADLRESGSIESDSDTVTFLYRDEVYDPQSEDRGVAEVILAKHRNGPIGTVKMAFIGNRTQFANMARI